MSFLEACEKFNITPVELSVFVTPDVYNELMKLARNNDSTLDTFLRDMIDYFLEHNPE